MKICGIIAEYNPFHNGHALHMAKTRAILGEDTALICIMSGNYVQRGAAALLEKYTRAQAAVCGGADLVLELPLPAALSSAEVFARGAVRALDMLGCVEYLSFGSECGSITALLHSASLLDDKRIQETFQQTLQKGLSYAAAREKCLSTLDAQAAALLKSPNNTLGIEYCRALQKENSLITPLTIPRVGAAHDTDEITNDTASASYIRQLVQQSQLADCRPLMPPDSYTLLLQAYASGQTQTDAVRFDAAILSYLRRLDLDTLTQYERAQEGLPNRLIHAIQNGTNFDEICQYAQTRRYPLARIRRALLRAFLEVPFTAAEEPITYLRVLAIGKNGREILRCNKGRFPLITKPLHEKKLPATCQPALQRDVRADELFTLTLPAVACHTGGMHYRRTPYCITAETKPSLKGI